MRGASRTRDPDTALIVTQNDRGEIVDVEIINVMTGFYLLFHGPNAPDPDREPYTGPCWWKPSGEYREQPEQGSD
jgi:hypothetical protein